MNTVVSISKHDPGFDVSPNARFDPELDTAEAYATLLGWPVRAEGQAVLLAMTCGLTALAIPRASAAEVTPLLKLRDSAGPVLALPLDTVQWVFLAEGNGLVPAQEHAPLGGRYLRPPTQIPLPPSVTPHGPVKWVIAPDLSRRWLPTLAAVICAARTVARTTRR